MANTYYPSIWGAEAGGLPWTHGQLSYIASRITSEEWEHFLVEDQGKINENRSKARKRHSADLENEDRDHEASHEGAVEAGNILP